MHNYFMLLVAVKEKKTKKEGKKKGRKVTKACVVKCKWRVRMSAEAGVAGVAAPLLF